MSAILVVAEQHKGKLRKASLNAMGAALELGKLTGAPVTGLVLGQGVEGAAQELAGYGASKVLFADHAGLENPLAEPHAKVIADAAAAIGATYVVAAATFQGKDVLPRAAARLNAGLASDVVGFAGEGAGVQFKRPMWAGNAIATVEVTTPVKVVTVRPTDFDEAAAGGSSPVEAFAADPGTPKTKFLVFEEIKSERPELTEAEVVIAGGRGTKGDFDPIFALADTLNAGVGASRAVVDAGWQPNDLQIGQTGKVVAPKLYFAVGISGAIQHLAGMKGSKTIVAINKDPDAPIFQVADYGLVDDLFKVMPELVEEIKKVRG